MKHIYRHTENYFEKITSVVTNILGNSITFILAICLVIFWFLNRNFSHLETNEIIRDAIHAITFLSLFVIQKAFSRFAGSLHLKVNELVSSHETANNSVLNVELKTEQEVIELQKEYNDLAEQILEAEEVLESTK